MHTNSHESIQMKIHPTTETQRSQSLIPIFNSQTKASVSSVVRISTTQVLISEN